MLKWFDHKSLCHIVLELPITIDDKLLMSSLFEKNYTSWTLEFGRIYSVDIEIINLLYQEIFENFKDIRIIVHKSKLSRYLHKLGFKATFDSLVKEDVVNIKDIEVVLIGGSADSSSKVLEIVENVSLDNLALVVVQHVEPNRDGTFDKILQRKTQYSVSYAKEGSKVKKAHIYLAPRDKHLQVENGYFYFSDEDKYNYAKPSISLCYESFSNYYKEKLLVIQECGYASDGVDKLELLKKNSSKLIIQDIDECEAKPMITNALSVGVHDYVLNLENIIDYIKILDKRFTKESWLEYLLDMIIKKYSYDFKLYHRDMLSRRFDVFMLKHGIDNIKDAVGVILFNRSAFKGFFLEVSINVTELFRKPSSFKKSSKLLDKFYQGRHNVKIWSAGCSSGEEVYSMAILLDIMKLLDKSIIYATDFNATILEEAKNGVYSKETFALAKRNFEELGLETSLDSYFTENNNFVVINEKIKKKALFFQHNLVEDSSFNEFDIIICKNVVIYFNDNLQDKVFKLFYDSLKYGGHLILGESEMLPSNFLNKFEQISSDCKIFKKVA